MKVRISFTVDVDAEAWMGEYGVGRDEVRSDVQEHAAYLVAQLYREMGVAR